MKFFLSVDKVIKHEELEIGSCLYEELSKARTVLLNAFALEQTYDVLIENYLAFEKEILGRTMDYLVRDAKGYDTFYEDINSFNLRLVNLLTTVKLFIDQSKQKVKKCIPEDLQESINIEQEFSKEYDKFKEYRFMEALRNHVQHNGLPIHFLSKGLSKDSYEEILHFEFHMELYCRLTVLKKDKSFKKEPLQEQEEKIDLKIAVRQYIESLSKIHNTFRDAISESTRRSRSTIENAHEKYKNKVGCNTDFLEAYTKTAGGKEGIIPLLLEWDDIRLQLLDKNRELKNLRKRYVTSLSKKKRSV